MVKAVSQHAEGGELEAILGALELEEHLDDPDYLLAKQKMKEAQELDTAYDNKVKAATDPVMDPKLQKNVFKKKIMAYNKPCILSVIGSLMAACIGLLNPIFGALMMKCTFGMLYMPDSNETPSQVMNRWAFWLAIAAAGMFVF